MIYMYLDIIKCLGLHLMTNKVQEYIKISKILNSSFYNMNYIREKISGKKNRLK